MIKHLIVAFLFGSIITLFVAQHDEWTQRKMGQVFQGIFQENFDSTITFRVKDLNFFAPHIIFENVVVNVQNSDEWSWRCKTFTVSFSWMHFISVGSIDMRVLVDGLEVKSSVNNGKLAIAPHLEKLMQKPDFPIPTVLKSVVLKKSKMYAYDKANKSTATAFWNSSSLKIGNVFKTSMYVTDGTMSLYGRACIVGMSGNMNISAIDKVQGPEVTVRVAGSFQSPHLGMHDICYITGTWERNHGRFSLSSAQNALVFDPIIVTPRDTKITARFPLSFAWRFAHNDVTDDRISGNGILSLHATRDASSRVEGQMILENVQYQHKQLCDTGKLTVTRRDTNWRGDVSVRAHSAELAGAWRWHEQSKQGNMHLTNVTSVPVPRIAYWHILPQDFSCRISSDHGIVVGSYDNTVTNILSNVSYTSHGELTVNDGIFSAQGKVNQQRYEVAGSMQPHFQLQKCIYYDQSGTPLITVSTHYQDEYNRAVLDGSVTFPFVRSLIYQMMRYDLQGEGVLNVHGTMHSDAIDLQLHLADATIRLPQTYNFIDGFDAAITFDIATYSLVMRDMQCSLHTGKVRSLRAIAMFDMHGGCTFMHVPVLFDRCLLNVKKDLFAIVSGRVLFLKGENNHPLIKGQLILDRAQLKENLFSDVFRKRLFKYTGNVFDRSDAQMGCDVTIETKAPIRVDTDFLQTNAKIHIAVKNTIQSPEISGSISLLSGSLAFPYKSLHITKGSIYFLPEQSYDPMIELVARNNIKKYNVTLHVTGSLGQHHIMLDSTPPLTQEQITTLLLVGSEEESLNIMMPALIVQNLKGLLFSANQSSALHKYFKPLLKQFNINLVPSFTDQSGRGGLRGAIEIDVNDRWRALIQKNFSLSEDTRFELEYLLSDDISLRGIRDERRDLGGEVEVRWKF